MKTAVVICPGRGTYNKAELGYVSRHFSEPVLLADFDAQREAASQESVSALDGADRFSMAKHTRGDKSLEQPPFGPFPGVSLTAAISRGRVWSWTRHARLP